VVTKPAKTTSRWSRFQEWISPWQPLTGGGVAAFADATWLRVFAFQFAGALGAGALVLASALMAWVPTVEGSLPELPEAGAEIRAGRLAWPGAESRIWAERPQLALGVVPSGGAPLGLNSDVQVEFRADALWLRGLLGVASLPYPPDLELKLTRTAGPAAWQAWRPVLAAVLGTSGFLLHLSITWVIGLLVLLPVWGSAALFGRGSGFAFAAKVSVMTTQAPLLAGWLALFGYSTRALSLSTLGFGLGSIPVLLTVWCVWSIVALPPGTPKASPSKTPNPFAGRK
jgi:hypothetical protein